MGQQQNGAGLRILVVEDELLIAEMIGDLLADLGCVVVGPTGRLDQALSLALHEDIDAAVLDVVIRGGRVIPVAEHLRDRRVPFLIASGCYEPALAEARRLDKPFSLEALRDWVRSLDAPRASLAAQ